MKHRKPSRRPAHPPIGPRPAAARLLIAGLIILLLATCDFAARLHADITAGVVGAIYRYSDFGGSMSASLVILVAAALGLDYWERMNENR